MKTIATLPPKLALALEYTEAAYWSKLYDSNTGLKVYASVIAGAFAGAIPQIDTLAMNRVIGLGVDREITAEDIDEILYFFKGAGTKRFFIQLSPHTIQQDPSILLQQKGFKHYNNWTKLLRKAEDPIPLVNSTLKVKEVLPSQALLYGEIIFKSFEWEDTRLIEWLAASVGKPGYTHYFAMHGDTPVGAAALHIMNGYASMAFAGVLPEYRNLGAQGILLKERIRYAQQSGCKSMISETAEQKLGKLVPSYRNMLRFGFEEAYPRQNWIYEY